MATAFKLRFSESDLHKWSEEYDYVTADLTVDVIRVGEFMQKEGYLDLPRLIRLCRWKTPRTQPFVKRNTDSFVREVTRIALSTLEERLRVEALTLLHGVSWPTASVILHFGHREPYPIIDFRALWSLGFDKPPRYEFNFWWEYVQCTRRLANKFGMTMHELDQALWQFSDTNQPVG